MTRLYLLRHAKARWAEPGDRDFDRALKKSGRHDTEAMAEVMVANGYVPDLVLCSTARRTRETWEVAAPAFADAEVEYVETLYDADSAGYLDIVRKRALGKSVMVVGHNPMIEDLAVVLAGSGEAQDELADGFPTCGLAVIEFDTDFADIQPGTGDLIAFLTPRALSAE
jgi:phosphohistidine phosphatase